MNLPSSTTYILGTPNGEMTSLVCGRMEAAGHTYRVLSAEALNRGALPEAGAAQVIIVIDREFAGSCCGDFLRHLHRNKISIILIGGENASELWDCIIPSELSELTDISPHDPEGDWVGLIAGQPPQKPCIEEIPKVRENQPIPPKNTEYGLPFQNNPEVGQPDTKRESVLHTHVKDTARKGGSGQNQAFRLLVPIVLIGGILISALLFMLYKENPTDDDEIIHLYEKTQALESMFNSMQAASGDNDPATKETEQANGNQTTDGTAPESDEPVAEEAESEEDVPTIAEEEPTIDRWHTDNALPEEDTPLAPNQHSTGDNESETSDQDNVRPPSPITSDDVAETDPSSLPPRLSPTPNSTQQ